MSTPFVAATAPATDVLQPLRVLVKETQYELTRLLRTRAFSLSVMGIPVMLYVLFGLSNRGTGAARYLIAGYACMGVVSSCLFGIGIGLALDRAQGWLDLKRASPMPAFAFLGAKVASCAAFGLIIAMMLMMIGNAFGGVSLSLSQAFALAAVVVAGAVPFAAMGFFVALLVPPSAGPAVINLIYLPLCFASGFWMPLQMLPRWLQAIAPMLPTYHLGQIAFAAAGMPAGGPMALHWGVLAAFTLLMLAAAWITFSRSEARA